MENKFYVYVYLDPRKPGKFLYGEHNFDFEPIYVGKGSGYRFREHLWSEEKLGRKNPYLKGKINNIKKELKTEPIILKIKENLTNLESYEYEKYLIKLIGRSDLEKGPLTNFTDGGEGKMGSKGKPWSKETREKIMAIRKIKPPRLGKHNSEETKRKQSIAHKGKSFSEDHKKALSSSAKVRANSKEWLESFKESRYKNKTIKVTDKHGKLIGEYCSICHAGKELKFWGDKVRTELKNNNICVTKKYIFEKI